MQPRRLSWHRSAERAQLLALYAEADALVEGWSCECSCGGCAGAPPEARCCDFATIGREPYPTAVEIEEVRHAMRARSAPKRSLPLAGRRVCPLLSREGRCTIYESRPLGCRTFFCRDARAPFGAKAGLPRADLQSIGRRVAALSARFAPHDPHPRSLVRALTGAGG